MDESPFYFFFFFPDATEEEEVLDSVPEVEKDNSKFILIFPDIKCEVIWYDNSSLVAILVRIIY